jgi:hypothetical protein
VAVDPGHQPAHVPAVGHEAVAHPALVQPGDDLVPVRVDGRLAAGHAHPHLGEELPRLVDGAEDERRIQVAHRGHVVPDAVGTTQVAVLGDGNAQDHAARCGGCGERGVRA